MIEVVEGQGGAPYAGSSASLSQRNLTVGKRLVIGGSLPCFPNHIPRQKVHHPLGQREPPGDKGRPHLPTAGFGQPRQPGRDDRGHDRTQKAGPADGSHFAGGAKGWLVDQVHDALSFDAFRPG